MILLEFDMSVKFSLISRLTILSTGSLEPPGWCLAPLSGLRRLSPLPVPGPVSGCLLALSGWAGGHMFPPLGHQRQLAPAASPERSGERSGL